MNKPFFFFKRTIHFLHVGKVKKHPQDFFSGDISVKNQKVSQIYGSYLGFIEFDAVRYWDFRELKPHTMIIPDLAMKSDPQYREDRKFL